MPKTLKAKKSATSLQLNEIIIQSIGDKKGEEVVCLDLRKINETLTDFFIVCHADNTTQVKSIADFVVANVEDKTGEQPWHTEGFENLEWILVDYVNVVVHIFLEKRRRFYQLEDLWADAKKLKISENGIAKSKKITKKKNKSKTVKRKSKVKATK